MKNKKERTVMSKFWEGTTEVEVDLDDIEIEISISDIVDELAKADAQELIIALCNKHGIDPATCLQDVPSIKDGLMNAIDKIKQRWYALNPCDEAVIEQIADKY